MKNIIKLFYLFSLFFLGCQTDQVKVSNFKYHLKIEKPYENIPFKQIVDDYKIINLETNSSTLIGKISKTLLLNDIFYLQDERGIYAFSIEGKSLFQINKRGKAPSEFISIFDFSVDNGKLYLYDQHQTKLIIYNSRTGNYLSEIKLPYSAKSIKILDDNIFMNRTFLQNQFLSKNDESRFILAKLEDPENIIYKTFAYDDKLLSYVYGELVSFNEEIYWIEPNFNKTYKWTGNKFINYFFADFGKKNATVNELTSNSPTELTKKGKVFSLENFYETTQFITCQLHVGRGFRKTILYDKMAGSYVVYTHTNGYSWEYSPDHLLGAYHEYFYRVLDPINNPIALEKLNESSGDSNLVISPENKAALERTKKNDNPILVLYKFKSIPGKGNVDNN